MSDLEQNYVTWRNKYLRSYEDGLYVYYKEPKENLKEMTCSEAHGYGMLISVSKRNQQDFDGLYRYYARFRNAKGLMQWQQKADHHGRFVPGDEGGENCATDGDVDICTALFVAAKVWGRGGPHGEIDYRQAATELAGCIYQHCINHQTHMPLIGDWADPGDDAYLLTRPSDFILSGYLIFYYEDTPRKDQWAQVIAAIVNCIAGQLSLNPQTGLIADFLKLDPNSGLYYPARGEVLESEHDKDYNWNSCRVPWRIGHYYMLTKDERVRPILETQAHFFAGQLARGGGDGDCGIKAGYCLDGSCYVYYCYMKISLTTVLVSLLSSLAVSAQNVVNVDVPKVNEMIYNKELLNITYSIIGAQTTNPPLNNYYPDSLNVDFVWTEHANTANTLSLQVSTGLNTNPYPGGSQTVQRKDTFRVPNCHFFSRYPPTTFDFSLVFTPIYNTITRTNGSIIEPTGTPQDKIIVPLAVTVDNSTFPKC